MTRPRVDFHASDDPLLRRPVLAHVVELPVLGIATRFATNSETVAALVEEDFGSWRTASSLVDATFGYVTVTIIVHDESDANGEPIRTRSTADGRLVIHGAHSVAVVDPLRRESVAYVAASLVADEERFRDEMLAAITFGLLAAFDRHPIHAAAISHRGRALLLAGESGAGKSTLACLAHLEGMRLMSDDLVWVQSFPRLRVWASTRGAHLRADALEKLAITDVHPAARVRDGKQRVAFPLATDADTWVVSADARVCLLVPGSRAAFEPVGPDVIEAGLLAQMAPGFDRFPEREGGVVRALAAPGGWRLTLSGEPRDALPFIETMLGVTQP